jgi:hypothetical protein
VFCCDFSIRRDKVLQNGDRSSTLCLLWVDGRGGVVSCGYSTNILYVITPYTLKWIREDDRLEYHLSSILHTQIV